MMLTYFQKHQEVVGNLLSQQPTQNFPIHDHQKAYKLLTYKTESLLNSKYHTQDPRNVSQGSFRVKHKEYCRSM